MKVKSLSHFRLFVTPWTAAYQAPPSMGFSRQEYWSGSPLPSPYKQLYDDKMDNLEEIDELLEKYNLPKLNQEETEHLNRLITSMEIKNIPTNKSPDAFTGESYQKFREDLSYYPTYPTQSLPEYCRGR